MAVNETATIRIDSSVKNTFDLMKKKKSSTEYLGAMLKYFSQTNIAPESFQETPYTYLEKRIEYMIKALKGIEKSKLDPMFDVLKSGKFSQNESSNTNESISLEEAQVLLEEHAQQQKDLLLKNQEIENLKSQLKQIATDIPQTDLQRGTLNKKAIFEALDAIVNLGKVDNFRQGCVVLNKADLNNYVDRIKNEINVCSGS